MKAKLTNEICPQCRKPLHRFNSRRLGVFYAHQHTLREIAYASKPLCDYSERSSSNKQGGLGE